MTKSLTRALRRRAIHGSDRAPDPQSRIINSYGNDEGDRAPDVRTVRRLMRYAIGTDMYPATKASVYRKYNRAHKIVNRLKRALRIRSRA
jgi:hypothetical protein